METIESLTVNKPLMIFSKSTCCLCHTVKTLIYSLGAKPTVYEVDEIPNGQQIEMALQELGLNPTVPAVFIGQKFVGGANEVISLHVQGKLVQLLQNT